MSAPADPGWLRLLLPASWVYRLAVAARNRAFDRGLYRCHRLPVPVVSVGNLTVGGTGKTPLVAWLVQRARAAGRTPGVLARGYGRAPGDALNDEGMLLARRFPGLLQEQDPDRVAAGQRLLARGADWVVLDDGFQHRRLARDVDLVCVDARRRFGSLLPAGRMREPAAALRRADAVVLTRADQLDVAGRAERAAAVVRAAGRDLPLFLAAHAPLDLVAMPDGEVRPVEDLAGRDVVLLSAIADNAAFAATVAGLGARIVRHDARRDHHRHRAAEVAALASDAAARDAALVVTEKDDVKLGGLAVPRLVLRVGLRFLGDEPADADLGLGRRPAP